MPIVSFLPALLVITTNYQNKQVLSLVFLSLVLFLIIIIITIK